MLSATWVLALLCLGKQREGNSPRAFVIGQVQSCPPGSSAFYLKSMTSVSVFPADRIGEVRDRLMLKLRFIAGICSE